MFIVNMEVLNTNKWLKRAVVDMEATLDVLNVQWDHHLPGLAEAHKVTNKKVYTLVLPSGYLTVRHGKSPCF